jgi:hypothetical protein
MEEVVYLIMGRQKDKFTILYADESEKATEKDYFTKNPRFKCWITNAGSEKNLYLSIYPMWQSDRSDRLRIVEKVVSRFKPVCNFVPPEPSPESKKEPQEPESQQLAESKEESETTGKETSEESEENQ